MNLCKPLDYKQICALIDAKIAALMDLGLVKLGQGDTLPADITNSPVTVQTPAGPVDVAAGAALPADMLGCVFVDPDEPGAAIYTNTGPVCVVSDGTLTDADGCTIPAGCSAIGPDLNGNYCPIPTGGFFS